MNRNTRQTIQGYLFLSPALIIFFVFTVLSILFVVGLSFTKYNILNGSISFVNFDNYIRLVQDKRFLIALKNTFRYVLIVVPTQTVFALLLSVALNSKIKFSTLFRTIFFLPTLTSSAALSMIFMFLFNVNGPINALFVSMGLLKTPINFLTEPQVALYVIMAMNIWATIPMFATIFIAGLQDITPDLYEAASIDGATGVQKFLRITVPMISPITMFIFLIGLIGCFQIFDQAYILSNGTGGPANSTLTVTLLIYQYAFTSTGTMGYASAIAVVLSCVIFLFSILTRRLQSSSL